MRWPLFFFDYCWSEGRSSKIQLPRHVCCLWTWGVSSGLRQRQQNPASEACLLPLDLGSFFGPSSEAAKSCFQVVFASFGLGEFLRVLVRGSRNPVPKATWLPLAQIGFIGVIAEAAETQFQRHDSCLWFKRVWTTLYKEIIIDLCLLTSAR